MTDRVFVQFLQIIRTPYSINNISIAFPGMLECDISWFKDYNSSDLRYWLYQVTIKLSAFQDVNRCSPKSQIFFSFGHMFTYLFSPEFSLIILSYIIYPQLFIFDYFYKHIIPGIRSIKQIVFLMRYFITNDSTQTNIC